MTSFAFVRRLYRVGLESDNSECTLNVPTLYLHVKILTLGGGACIAIPSPSREYMHAGALHSGPTP